MQQEIQSQPVPVLRRRLRGTLLPYASYAALTGLQIIFLFGFFHDSLVARLLLFWYAILVGVVGSVPLLRALTSRKTSNTNSLALFQRSLPSLLLLAWGESHVLDCSYIPFNRFAFTIWFVYVAVGLFFGVVRAAHRASLRRDQRQHLHYDDQPLSASANAVSDKSLDLLTSRSALSSSPSAPVQEAVVAGRL